MKALLATLCCCVSAAAFGVVPAPPRVLTDPRTLTAPANPSARPVRVSDLFFTRANAGAAWSPDGKDVVVSTNLSGRFNLWRVSSGGSWPRQLMQSDDRQSGMAWSPDGQWIVFQSDHAGGEVFDLYAIAADGGAAIDLTATDDISETSPLWSPDGKTLAFERKGKSASTTDVELLDWTTRGVRQLTHEKTPGERWQIAAWSDDGLVLYANRANAGHTDASAWRIDVASGAAKELTPHRGQQLITMSAATRDGSTLALTSNANGGVRHAALFDVQSGRYRWIDQGPWESDSGPFSPDGKQLLWSLNVDGRTDIYTSDPASGRRARVDLPPGVNLPVGGGRGFAADGRFLASHQASNTPADYWIVDREGRATQLTYSALASLAPSTLPSAQLVHYASFDGTVISAFVLLPFNLARDGRAPAVVLPHGGPTWQTMDAFDRTATALASRGYVTIAPNVRGSTGYGLAFQKANYKDLGGGDLQDELYAAKFLIATGYVDARKIGITGGSYGGFMALMALGRTPDAWAAGVDLFGITNWLSEQQHEEPALRQYDQSILGDPVEDRAVYERCSPTTYFANVKAPLLVLQGENDIRDPKEEAEQAFKTLTASGKIAQVHYYPGEGHGFAKRENQIDALERTVAWFDRYLKGEGNGITQPPNLKPLVGSPLGAPGTCMTPSSETWAPTMILRLWLSPFSFYSLRRTGTGSFDMRFWTFLCRR